MRVAVVGSRSIGEEHYGCIEKNIPENCTEILSGGAVGVDSLARRYAQEKNIKITEILPDYKSFDKMAPIIRNSEIVHESDMVLIFWDGVSKGSRNVIMTCIKTNKPYKILLCKDKV